MHVLRWLDEIASVHVHGTTKAVSAKLLIVGEIGYMPFGRDEANLFLNVGAKRYDHGSMVLTSNLPFTQSASAFRQRPDVHGGNGGPRAHRANRR